MKLGVFDSGIGGEAIAESLHSEFPKADMIVVNDRDHVPYGSRSGAEVIELTIRAIQPLLAARCDAIVIACNTATALAIETLRAQYPEQQFIGIEPMLKPASLRTKTGVIAVCATPATLASDRYLAAKRRWLSDLYVLEPDCSDWASLIEQNQINRQHIEAVITDCLDHQADVIVLGCTHYHWIKSEIMQLVNGRAAVLEPSEAIGRRIRELLGLPIAPGRQQ